MGLNGPEMEKETENNSKYFKKEQMSWYGQNGTRNAKCVLQMEQVVLEQEGSEMEQNAKTELLHE